MSISRSGRPLRKCSAPRSSTCRKRHSLRAQAPVSRRGALRRGFELAGDVAALLRQAAEAVGVATHFIDVEVALMVQRRQQFGHAFEHRRNMFLEYSIS